MINQNLILNTIPQGTKYVVFNTDDDGNSYEIQDIKDVDDKVELACNVFITTALDIYGVDMSNIAHSILEDTTNRILDNRKLLKMADVSETEIGVYDADTDTSTNVSLMDYIAEKWQIYDWFDFVDDIFSELSETVYLTKPINDELSSQDSTFKDGVYSQLSENLIDKLKVAAEALGGNIISAIPFGDDQIINIPLDLENVNDTFTYLGNLLIDKGYVNESLRDNFTISGWMQFSLNPVTGATGNAFNNNIGFNNNGEFKYLHCYIIDSIINTNQHVWTPVLFATKKEIKPIVFEQASVNYNNLNGYVGYLAHLYDKTTSAEDMTKQYMLWYGRNHGNDSGSSYQNIWYDMATQTQIFSDNELINGCDETYNVYYNGGLGNGNSVARNELGTYVKLPIRRWNGVYVSSEMTEISLNNQMVIHGFHLNNPNIDSYAVQALIDGVVGIIGTINRIIHIYISSAIIPLALKPTLTPLDIGDYIRVGTIDISVGVRLNNPTTTVSEYEFDIISGWQYLWSDSVVEMCLGDILNYDGGVNYYKLTKEQVVHLIRGLWDLEGDSDAWEMLKDIFGGDDFINKLLGVKVLPYALQEDVAHIDENNNIVTDIENEVVPFISAIPFGKADEKLWARGQLVHKRTHTLRSRKIWVQPVFNGFLDYEPNMKVKIYIPFVGYRDLPASLVINNDISLVYKVSNYTGDFVVEVLSQRHFNTENGYTHEYTSLLQSDDGYTAFTDGDLPDNGARILKGAPILIESGNMALDVNLSADTKKDTDIIRALIPAITGVGQGLAGSTSNKGVHHINGNMLANSAVSAAGVLMGMRNGDIVSTPLAGNDCKYLANMIPYIMLIYNTPIHSWSTMGTPFDQTIGHVTQVGKRLSQLDKGYHEIDSIKLEGLQCTNDEKEEIIRILKSGFYYGGDYKLHNETNDIQ